jgi:hypothetical protein
MEHAGAREIREVQMRHNILTRRRNTLPWRNTALKSMILNRHIVALLVTAIAGLTPVKAEKASGTLTLVPATSSDNRLTVTISASSGGFNASDSKTTNVTGNLNVTLDTNVETGATSEFTINGGSLAMTNMNFNLRALGFISVAKINTSGMAGTAYTSSPPGVAAPTSSGGTFDASQHRLLINQGAITGELTVPGDPVVPINESFATSPVEGAGSGTGNLTVTPTTISDTRRFFAVTMTLPVDFTESQTISGTPVNIRVQGNIKASGTTSVLISEELATWTFNTGATSAARRSASNVSPGTTVSGLAFNASFIDFGPGVVPSGAHDGIGFGSNSGDSVIFLKRANYFDSSAVPSPRPTVTAYTSWGVGASAGTGANLSANGNAPIAFTVSAGALSTVTIESLTVDFTSGANIIIQFQEAGATPGAKVTLSPTNRLATVPLAARVEIGPGQSKTFTINLDSGSLNTGHNIDGISLNGVAESDASRYELWASDKGLTVGVNDGFDDNPDSDAFANGLEWILASTTPLATDRIAVGGTGELLNMNVDGGKLIFTFKRLDESEGDATLKVQFSNDLFAADNHEVIIGAGGPGGSPPLGVTVEVIENGAAADDVRVIIPATYASSNGRLFGRLRASQP